MLQLAQRFAFLPIPVLEPLQVNLLPLTLYPIELVFVYISHNFFNSGFNSYLWQGRCIKGPSTSKFSIVGISTVANMADGAINNLFLIYKHCMERWYDKWDTLLEKTSKLSEFFLFYNFLVQKTNKIPSLKIFCQWYLAFLYIYLLPELPYSLSSI